MVRQKLVAVQVLRALAALAVAVHHAQHDATALAARSGSAFVHSALFPWPAGVDIFFVISGFIMVHSSAGLFGRPGAPRVFLERRIARIVPLYWTVTTLLLVVGAVAPGALNSTPPGFRQIVASFLFIPMAGPDGMVPIYSLGWTLNYEMFFYVVFAAAIVLPRERAVATAAAALVLIVIAGRIVEPLPQPLGFWGAPIVLEFVSGMALGLLRVHGAALSTPARLVLATLGLVLFHVDLTRPDAVMTLPGLVAYGVPASLLVAAAAFHREAVRPPIPERILAALGDASYALYLVHPFVIRALRELFFATSLAQKTSPWFFVGLALAAAVAASLLVYRLFERPLTERLRRRLGTDGNHGAAFAARSTDRRTIR